jgi:hypothetical protein
MPPKSTMATGNVIEGEVIDAKPASDDVFGAYILDIRRLWFATLAEFELENPAAKDGMMTASSRE